MKASIAQGKSWNQELNAFLLNYHATPHSSTGTPPATLMFGREIQTSLPRLSSSQQNPNVRKKDADAKEKMKTYADQKRHVRECVINIGDNVLVKREGMKKSDPEYSPKPWKVTERNGKTMTRNSSRFKPSPRSPKETADESSDDDSEVLCPPRLSIPAPLVQPVPQLPPPAGRPQRQRRRPARLQDFVAQVKNNNITMSKRPE